MAKLTNKTTQILKSNPNVIKENTTESNTAIDDTFLDRLTDKEKNELIKQITESNAKHQAEVLLLKKFLEPYKKEGRIDRRISLKEIYNAFVIYHRYA